jgi:hypothetical protein
MTIHTTNALDESMELMTSNCNYPSVDFDTTIKDLNWENRVERYGENCKVLVNPEAKGDLGKFGLSPGQINGKIYTPNSP